MAKGAETRDAILRRAVSLASVVGLEGLTIDGLASEMGLSKSGLIAHFGTKESLQLSVLQSAAQLFANRVVIPARREPAGEARVRALFNKWLEWPTSQDLPGGCLFVTATTELDDRPGGLRFFLNKVQKEWIDVIQGAVGEAKELGEFGAKLDSWADMSIYLALFFGNCLLWPDFINAHLDLLLGGFGVYTAAFGFGYLKYGRLTSYHTLGGKLSAVLMACSMILWFFGGPDWPFRLALVIALASGIEQIGVTAVLPYWRPNVLSLCHALLFRRGTK